MGKFIEIDIGIAIEIEKRCNGNAFDSEIDSDFDPDKVVPRSPGARKDKSTPVLQTFRLKPGAKHPVLYNQ